MWNPKGGWDRPSELERLHTGGKKQKKQKRQKDKVHLGGKSIPNIWKIKISPYSQANKFQESN